MLESQIYELQVMNVAGSWNIPTAITSNSCQGSRRFPIRVKHFQLQETPHWAGRFLHFGGSFQKLQPAFSNPHRHQVQVLMNPWTDATRHPQYHVQSCRSRSQEGSHELSAFPSLIRISNFTSHLALHGFHLCKLQLKCFHSPLHLETTACYGTRELRGRKAMRRKAAPHHHHQGPFPQAD